MSPAEGMGGIPGDMPPEALPPEMAAQPPEPDYASVKVQQQIQQADEKHQMDMAMKRAQLEQQGVPV